MSLYLTNNPLQPGAAYPDNLTASQYQFIEKTYSSGTTQEWIYAPASGNVSVTLSFTSATGSIECTDSPPSVVETGTPVTVTWPAGVVGATTSTELIGFTAFRVNKATGTSVKLSCKAM